MEWADRSGLVAFWNMHSPVTLPQGHVPATLMLALLYMGFQKLTLRRPLYRILPMSRPTALILTDMEAQLLLVTFLREQPFPAWA